MWHEKNLQAYFSKVQLFMNYYEKTDYEYDRIYGMFIAKTIHNHKQHRSLYRTNS